MSGQMPFHPSDEERVAADMARELEAMKMTTSVQPGEDFADRVMLAIADEPLPQPVRAFGLALLGGHLRTAAAAIGDAWRTISSAPAPLAVRAQALALVLVVVVGSVALAGGATVGAMGLFGTTPPAPTQSGPPPSQPTPSTILAPEPSPSPSPSDEPSAAETADPSEDAGASEDTGATETPDSHETAQPTNRPRTATPTATETDDHGGGDPGSGGDPTTTPTPTIDHSGSDG